MHVNTSTDEPARVTFMATRDEFTIGPDVPATETLRDSAGQIVDDAYVDAAVDDAIHRVRGRGRPSLSETGESPLLRVRISRELDESVRIAAEAAGTTRSEWVRQALQEAARRAG
jgi:predicted HicB family RNase H-like nuclease